MREVITAFDTAQTRSARGAKARAKIKRAGLKVLEREGYHRMKIADVTKEAGVAQGLFYHYFADLKTLTLEVLGDYVAHAQEVEKIERDVAKGDWYQRIYAHNNLVVRSYSRRPGIMRCVFQLADEDQVFGSMLRAAFLKQMMWLVELMPYLFPRVAFKEQQALMVAYALAGAGETLLKEYFVNQNDALTASRMDDSELTELLSVMFYRGLFLENPPAEELNYTKNLTDMVKTD